MSRMPEFFGHVLGFWSPGISWPSFSIFFFGAGSICLYILLLAAWPKPKSDSVFSG